MYATYFKRTLISLILSLTVFALCFTVHISAQTSSVPEGESETPSIATSVEDPFESVPSDVTSIVESSEVSSEAMVSDSESADSQISSDVSSEPFVSGSVSEESSALESSMVDSSLITSSQEASSLVVEIVSEGGAPDDTDEQYYNNGSYVYHGSYAGLSSTVSSDEEQASQEAPNRTSNAQRYATYATVGMIIFGLISLAMIALLIYFNLKVKESKKLHPEWYPKKEKAENGDKPKHAKH